MTEPGAGDPRPLVICLMGPTASGKTDLAIELARARNCELISVDSALVYRGLDIGSAKPDFPHHLVDILDPSEAYSAADFAADAHRLVAGIHGRGAIPLLVGGTMLYFKAFLEGLANMPPADRRYPPRDRGGGGDSRLALAARAPGGGGSRFRAANSPQAFPAHRAGAGGLSQQRRHHVAVAAPAAEPAGAGPAVPGSADRYLPTAALGTAPAHRPALRADDGGGAAG